MALTLDERLVLLRTLSYARASSHASIDTISNSSLVAFLQVQDVLRSIGSRKATVHTIDVVVNLMVSLLVDLAGPLGKLVGRRVLSRIVNTRVVSGKFVSQIPGVELSTTMQLYDGVQRRFTFSTVKDALASHRLEQAVARHGEQGIGGLLSKSSKVAVDKLMANRTPRTPRAPELGLAPRVAIVDAATTYAVYQRFITDLIFDELQELVRLDTGHDLAYFDGLVKDLTALYVPFKYGGVEVALDQQRESFTHSFEEMIWSAVFLGNDRTNLVKKDGTHSDVRIVYWRDTNKDIALTRYLLKRFAPSREYYSETSSKDFHIFSQVSLMVDNFRKIAGSFAAWGPEFVGAATILEVENR